MSSRRTTIALWAAATTAVAEAVTLAVRFGTGVSAVEFNRTAPLVLQIHHMFWSIPLFLLAAAVWRRPQWSGPLVGLGLGLVASDLLHHFAILPLWTGTTGWHWP